MRRLPCVCLALLGALTVIVSAQSADPVKDALCNDLTAIQGDAAGITVSTARTAAATSSRNNLADLKKRAADGVARCRPVPVTPSPTPTPTPVPTPTPDPVPVPVPASTGAAVLEDFSNPIRILPGADHLPLLSFYQEGATGSAAIVDGALVATVGAAFDTTKGGVYVQFQPKPNNSYAFPGGYAQSYLVAGVWNKAYNRLSFRVKTTATIAAPSNGAPNFEVGTYVRAHSEPDANFQGAHFYHQMGLTLAPNQWATITINCVPQHQVSDNGKTNYPCNPTGDPYFDDLTRFYFDGIYGGGANATWTFDDFTFSQITGEPDALVASVAAQYDGSKYVVSWQAPKNVTTTYAVHYSPMSMHSTSFSAGADGGTVSSTGNTYASVRWTSKAMAQPIGGMFVAIQPVGQTTFTETFVPQP